MKPLYKHVLTGFAVGVLAMPLWILIGNIVLQAMSVSAETLAEYPLAFTFDYPLIKMVLGGIIGVIVVLSVFDLPKWIRRVRNKEHSLTTE